jgi:transposase
MPTPQAGRPRKTELREVVNALLYIASTGCQWRMPPKDFPSYSTVQGYFTMADDYQWWTNHHPIWNARTGRKGSPPTAGVIDSQSAKTTEAEDCGLRRGQKPKPQRHIVISRSV